MPQNSIYDQQSASGRRLTPGRLRLYKIARPIALALLKRGLPADTELATGADASVPAVIDVDSLPPTEQIGAGRLAVQRLRGGTR